MTWAEPRWLLWLFALPLVAAGLAIAGQVHGRRLRRLVSEEIATRILPPSVRRRRTVRDVAIVAGLAAIVVALAEPRFDKVVRTFDVQGSDIVVLLDLSRSMDARDVDPSRLERARREIDDLGAVIGGDRIGLVVFAGGAYARLPLTADFRAVQLVVRETRTDDFDTQGSALGAAIRAGLELLERSKDKAGQAMLVLSDGEIHDPADAIAAADLAAERRVPIFAMGIGDAAAPIPLPDGRSLQYKGETVQTVPEFDTLKEVARRTGGAFVVSNVTSRDMSELFAEIQRSVLAVQRSVQQRETYNSGFQYPLGLAAALLCLASWLGEGRRAFGAAAVALLLLAAAPPGWAADPLVEADQLFRDGKYPLAVEKLVDLSLERPDDPEVFERLGAARYRAGDFLGATQAFDRAASLSEDPATALYNSGNAHYMTGQLEDAVTRYEQALEADPGFGAAEQNRDLVRHEIEARRAVEPPPPPQPQQGNQGQPPPEPPPSDGEEPPEQPSDPSDPSAQDPEQGQEPLDPSQVRPDEPPSDSSAPSTPADEDTGPITAAQAERLLDSVEEGSRRTVVQGRQEGKPW